MNEENIKKVQGRVNGKNSAHKSGQNRIPKFCSNQIEELLKNNVDQAAFKNKKVGSATQIKRKTDIRGFFSDLFYLRYKIESVYNLRDKHLKAVFNFLEEQGQSPATIQNKISIMRLFCKWIGKAGMVRDSSQYVKNKESVRRTTVVQEDKSWEGKGLSILDKLPEIAAKDQVVAIWIEQCSEFGLRISESIMLRPAMAHEGDFVWIRESTKGGRPRVIPIENAAQRDLLERAKQMGDGKTGYLGVRGKSKKQKLRRVYTVMEALGITLKDKGVTPHGLRHEYMQRSFKGLLGSDSPIKGGDLSQIDPDKLQVASQKLMERAGHSRVSIGSAYYGSRRRPKKLTNLNPAGNSTEECNDE